jgi:predicted methyltransferase
LFALLLAFAPQPAAADDGKLATVLAAQPDEAKARYQYRHPQETIEFFGIEPGMTVVEGLPGGGWYTKVLLPYLGSEGGT